MVALLVRIEGSLRLQRDNNGTHSPPDLNSADWMRQTVKELDLGLGWATGRSGGDDEVTSSSRFAFSPKKQPPKWRWDLLGIAEPLSTAAAAAPPSVPPVVSQIRDVLDQAKAALSAWGHHHPTLTSFSSSSSDKLPDAKTILMRPPRGIPRMSVFRSSAAAATSSSSLSTTPEAARMSSGPQLQSIALTFASQKRTAVATSTHGSCTTRDPWRIFAKHCGSVGQLAVGNNGPGQNKWSDEQLTQTHFMLFELTTISCCTSAEVKHILRKNTHVIFVTKKHLTHIPFGF
jgi:hypothetical protein